MEMSIIFPTPSCIKEGKFKLKQAGLSKATLKIYSVIYTGFYFRIYSVIDP